MAEPAAVGRPPVHLVGDRRRRHERLRARGGAARRDGQRLRPRRLARAGALRALGVAVHVGHDAANVPAGADVFVSTAIPADNPERVAARPSAPRRAAARADRAQADHRRRRRARQDDDDLDGRPRAARRAALEPGYLIGGALRTTGLNADWGDGRLARGRGRRVRPLDARAGRRGRGRPEHRARPPRDLRRRWPSCDEVFDEFRAGAPGARRRAGAGARRRRHRLRRPARSARRRRLALHLARPRRRADRPRRAQRAQRGRRAGGVRARRRRRPRRGGRARWRPSPAPAGASSASARRRRAREVVDDYAHHPTEVAATIAAARTLAPRRVVASSSRTCTRARRSWPASSARRWRAADVAVVLDVYPARERAEDFPGVTGPTDRRGGRRPRRRPPGPLAADARRRRARRWRRACAPATSSSSWAPATSARSAARWSPSPPIRRLPDDRAGTAARAAKHAPDAPRRRHAAGPQRAAPAAVRLSGPSPSPSC